MRSIALTSAILGVSLLVPITSAATAGDAPEARDWRATACIEEPGLDVTVSGAHTVVTRQVTPVAEVPGMTLRVDRLDFSGVTCELFYVRGAIPAGAAVSLARNSFCTYTRWVLNGVDEGEGASCTSFAGPTSLYPSTSYVDVPNNVMLAAAVTYRPHESGVLTAEPGMPPELVDAPYSVTYVRSEWFATLAGKTLVKRPFERTNATDKAAQASYEKRAARAARIHAVRVADIRASDRPEVWKRRQLVKAAAVRSESMSLARRTYRLAEQGVRLVKKRFSGTYTGTVHPAH
ncbi:hypothetical protein [Nocardioides sp.]|uniref:hypothetical protein n=1 Tax=Nocardioides sp. TaxID=35761 RepID=UPI002CC3D362|nr:hypothetical protein [Nocardioides sp.]HXH80710.1 hypothetical protein [Nocardioides sp.]